MQCKPQALYGISVGGTNPNTGLKSVVGMFGAERFRWCAGLHEGLGSLVSAGVPPRFLIIDDGWQCTDVDRRFRQPPTTRTVC